ncbi:hypothetical protein ADK57_27615 [Streptomyces sp. MMG1533]|uniref:hypothetical protein n=1 Tax=Streptomyces sp. MMG1533 TaxID=1415546 RepID=UPI0006ADFD8A|nr:hypothetical protein [Streptomyces sp. MMG1533]KOU61522.1 hypothetical protein ADK57_27615 [Streptomyces sp. MMG1533]
MTRVLPTGYSPLPFSPDLGLPQQVQVRASGRSLAVKLVALTADLVATLTAPPTTPVVTDAQEESRRLASLGDPRAALTAPPPPGLDGAAVRPYLVVVDADRVVGSAPVVVGRPMAVGTSADSGLLLEVLFVDLFLAAGSLVEPGDVGSRILAGFRDPAAGHAVRPRRPAAPEGDPHDLLD